MKELSKFSDLELVEILIYRNFSGDSVVLSTKTINDELLSRLKRGREAIERVQNLEKEVEYEQMRLAACGVAAMSNTEETIKDRLTVEHEYHSGSYDSVCAAVDREMKYREQLRAAEELVEKIWVIYGEYYSTLMDDKIFTTTVKTGKELITWLETGAEPEPKPQGEKLPESKKKKEEKIEYVTEAWKKKHVCRKKGGV